MLPEWLLYRQSWASPALQKSLLLGQTSNEMLFWDWLNAPYLGFTELKVSQPYWAWIEKPISHHHLHTSAWKPSEVTSRVTVISLAVRVPVLSEQMTLQQPDARKFLNQNSLSYKERMTGKEFDYASWYCASNLVVRCSRRHLKMSALSEHQVTSSQRRPSSPGGDQHIQALHANRMAIITMFQEVSNAHSTTCFLRWAI